MTLLLYCCAYIFRNINCHVLLWSVFSTDLSMVKTDVKNVLLKSLFFQEFSAIFLFMSFACHMLVVFCF